MAVPLKPTKEYLTKVLAEKQAKQLNDELATTLNRAIEKDPALGKLFFPPQKPKRQATARAKPAERKTSPEQQPMLFDCSTEYQ
jgi:hypothetical protein